MKLDAAANERLALVLLTGQTFFLALTLSLLQIAGSALFLVDFGSETLPLVYIATAIFGSLLYFGYAQLQQRRPLSQASTGALTTFASIGFVAWLGLNYLQFRWISFILLIAFVLGAQLTFIVVGGQAGRLFNVRQLKRLFPMVLIGLQLGFMTGGLLLAPLTLLLGKTENLLLAATASTLLALLVLRLTAARFGSRLTASPGEVAKHRPPKSLPELMRKRHVALIFTYQTLAAIVMQLVWFIFLDQAELNFPAVEDLARFFGSFTIFLSLLTILFLVAPAGLLLNRYGLRLGLAAHPVVIAIIAAAMVAVGPALGLSSVLFFGLAISARVLDIMLTAGTTNPSLKATYQALPANARPLVETVVEGIGVPLAIGVAGIILLGFNSFSSLSLIYLILFTVAVTLLWLATGMFTFREYAAALRRTLTRRALGNTVLSLDDRSSLAVVERLLQSPKLGEVRLGLDMLEQAEHDSLAGHLVGLSVHPEAQVRTEALSRIARSKLAGALPVVRSCLRSEGHPSVKGAALRALCALTESDAVEDVQPYLEASDPDLKLGAMVGLLRDGGIPGVVATWAHLQKMQQADEPAERSLVAQVIGQVGIRNFFQPLLPLLADEDFSVRQAALIAAGQVNHPRLLPHIIMNLTHRRLRSAAMGALVAGGETILPTVEKALAGETQYNEEDVIRLLRVCGQIKGEQAISLLKQHLNHPLDQVRNQVLIALDQVGYRAGAGDLVEIERALKGEVEHGLRVLLARQDVGQEEALPNLHRVLDYEFDQAQKRVFLLLSFIYDARAILRAADLLTWGSQTDRALALETLDVTLVGEHKEIVFSLVHDNLTLPDRIRQLEKHAWLPRLSANERLREIIADPQGVWTHGWTRACAIYAAARLSFADLADVIEQALSSTEDPIPETAAWALNTLAPEKYRV
jgi:ATP:ADP antiporter, AAA family